MSCCSGEFIDYCNALRYTMHRYIKNCIDTSITILHIAIRWCIDVSSHLYIWPPYLIVCFFQGSFQHCVNVGWTRWCLWSAPNGWHQPGIVPLATAVSIVSHDQLWTALVTVSSPLWTLFHKLLPPPTPPTHPPLSYTGPKLVRIFKKTI